MVTWYGQHIRFEQGSCQFLGGRGEGGSFCFQMEGWNLGGFFVLGRALGLLASNIHYLCFYFLFFLLPRYLTLPYLANFANLGPFFFLSTKTACWRGEEYSS